METARTVCTGILTFTLFLAFLVVLGLCFLPLPTFFLLLSIYKWLTLVFLLLFFSALFLSSCE